MKRTIYLAFILLFIQGIASGQFSSKLSIGINMGIGYDMQQNNLDYFPTKLIIPSNLGNSILRIENPKRYSGDIGYDINTNFEVFVSYGQTLRSMKYWSLDSLGTRDNCLHCKMKLKIKQNDLYFGIKLKTNFNSKVNFYFSSSLGLVWIKPSSRNATKKHFNENTQKEIISLHDDRDWYAVHVLQDGSLADSGTLSLKYTIGSYYKIWKSAFLTINFSYNNELNNASDLVVWDYDNLNKIRTGGYNQLHLKFKSLYTNIGLKVNL